MSPVLRRALPCPIFALVLAVVLATLPASAEDLRFRSVPGEDSRFQPGEDVRMTVALDGENLPVYGLSFGVAPELPLGDVIAVDPTPFFLTVNAGGAPDFVDVQIVPGGFTASVTICSPPCAGWTVPATFFGTRIFEFTLAPTGIEGVFPIEYSDALGTPAVPLEVVTDAGPGPFDEVFGGEVCISVHEEWEFAIGDLDVPYDRTTGEAAFTATATIGQYSCSGFIAGSPGFAFGIAHDPALLGATDVRAAPPILMINGGNGPDFLQTEIYPDGITVGCVASLIGADWFQFPGATPTMFVDYTTVPGALAGATMPTTTALSWSDALGTPPVSVIIMPGDSSIVPQGITDGVVTLEPVDVQNYVRGDVNEDGGVNVADAVSLLAHLFQGGAGPACAEVGDINTDGGTDIGDPICILLFLFAGGHPPHAPYPDCGSVAPDDCDVASAACP